MKLQDEKSQLESRILPLNGVQGIGMIASGNGNEEIEIAVVDEATRSVVAAIIDSEFA